MDTETGYAALLGALGRLDKVLVAFSGGVDSTFLLRAALAALPSADVLAVTLDTPFMPRAGIADATRLARALGARQVVVALPFPETLRHNPTTRCALCKGLLFSRLRALAQAEGIGHVLDGTNADDVHEYRPGLRALEELGIESPLLAAGLGKAAIRELSRALGLPTWDKPSAPCLLTRFPHDVRVADEALGRVEQAEAILGELGFPGARLRVHGQVARVEVAREGIAALVAAAARHDLDSRIKALGFRHVAVDLAGYQRGSLDPITPAGGGTNDHG